MGIPVDNKHRLRVKIQENEFEAEGSETTVSALFAEFKNLVEKSRDAHSLPAPDQPPQQHPRLPLLFNDHASYISLRILPGSQKGPLAQIAQSTLLLLFGHKELKNELKVSVLTLTKGLKYSGFTTLKRLSNAYQALENQGLAIKSGKGKGTAYAASDKGIQTAQEHIEEILAKAHIK